MSTLLVPALTSSIIESIITHPIDFIKIHKQVSQPVVYNLKNLYTGFFIRASGNIPSRTIFLFSQDYIKMKYSFNKYSESIIIPFCAGFSQTLVDTPVEVLKMNQIMKINNNSLYKGFIPHLGRNIIFIFHVYNFRQLSVMDENIVLPNSSYNCFNNALFGAIGGIIGSYVSHPLDTIKTCLQTNKSYKNYKMIDYFKGCHLRASISMINMFISIYVFEHIKKGVYVLG